MIGKTNAVIGGSGGGTHVAITFTVEGAKGDNISIIDVNGVTVGNIIFDTDAASAEYTMAIPISGGAYTFTSSVSKDTETVTSDYSKTIELFTDTKNVKVMPDTLLMVDWYGNRLIDFSDWVSSGVILADNYANTLSLTDGSSYIQCNTGSTKLKTATRRSGNTYDLTNATKVCAMYWNSVTNSLDYYEKTITGKNGYIGFSFGVDGSSYSDCLVGIAESAQQFWSSSSKGTIWAKQQTNVTHKLYAWWFE